MRYEDILYRTCAKHGREPLFVALVLEAAETGCAELTGTEQQVDERCICHSLQKIINYFTTDKAPRENYDAQDAAIELEAIARFVADKSAENPRYKQTYDLFKKLPAVYWHDGNAATELLQQILATFSVSDGG